MSLSETGRFLQSVDSVLIFTLRVAQSVESIFLYSPFRAQESSTSCSCHRRNFHSVVSKKKKKKKNRPATSRIIHDNAVAFSVVVVFRIPCSCRFSEKGRGCERAKNRSGKESTGVKTRGLFSASCF